LPAGQTESAASDLRLISVREHVEIMPETAGVDDPLIPLRIPLVVVDATYGLLDVPTGKPWALC
jgi:hypothetical protein